MFHTIAWGQSVNPAGAFQAITAIREEMLFASGNDIRVHPALPFLIAEAALINDASAARAEVQSPSLRTLANIDVEPIVPAAVFANPQGLSLHPENPTPVIPDEALNFFVQSAPAAAVQHFGLVWMSDGPINPVKGNIIQIRFTAAIAQLNTAWVNGNITFQQTLPAGLYQCVGLRIRSADAVAARLLFVGQVPRPGVPVVATIGGRDDYFFRYGRMGVFGQFPNTVPPTLDVLGGAAAAQTGVMDLIKVK